MATGIPATTAGSSDASLPSSAEPNFASRSSLLPNAWAEGEGKKCATHLPTESFFLQEWKANENGFNNCLWIQAPETNSSSRKVQTLSARGAHRDWEPPAGQTQLVCPQGATTGLLMCPGVCPGGVGMTLLPHLSRTKPGLTNTGSHHAAAFPSSVSFV